MSVDGSNHRLTQIPGLNTQRTGAEVHLPFGTKGITTRTQISPRTKRFTSTRDNDHSHRIIFVAKTVGFSQTVLYSSIERVQRLRAIERNQANAVIDFQSQVFIHNTHLSHLHTTSGLGFGFRIKPNTAPRTTVVNPAILIQ